MDKLQKLQLLIDKKDPLKDILNKVEIMKGEKGETGEPGYSPIKGKDYFTDTEVNNIIINIQSKVKNGIDGKEGKQGLRGLQGERGFAGRDGKDGINGKDGISPDIKLLSKSIYSEVIFELDKKGINENIVTKDELVSFLKRGGFRGGGISDIAGLITAGTNVTITGSGTSSSPYVISSSGSGGGGVSSLNSLTGALSLTSTGGTINITPSGTTVNIESALSLQTNGILNSSQTTLNLLQDAGIILTDYGGGGIGIAATTVPSGSDGNIQRQDGGLLYADGDLNFDKNLKIFSAGDITEAINRTKFIVDDDNTKIVMAAEAFRFESPAIGFGTYIFPALLTGDRMNTFPDANGTFALSVNGTYADSTGNITITTGGVSSVSGTTNRITSTGGTTPVIDISSTFEGLLAKLAGTQTFTGINTFTPTARSSGALSYLTINAPADTGITTATESKGINHVGSTRTWVDGTTTTQREYYFGAPTYNKTTTSATFTNLATVAISGAPTAGTGVTFTHPWSLWVQGGNSHFGGQIGATQFAIAGTGAEFNDTNNTTGGHIVNAQNISNGTSAFSGFGLGNDQTVDGGATAHFFGIYFNSSTYTDTSFGTAFAIPSLGSLQNSDGPVTISAQNATGYVNFLAGGSNTTNEIGRWTTTGLTVGLSGTLTGQISFAGATSGTAILKTSAVAGTPTITLPIGTTTLLGNNLGLSGGTTLIGGTAAGDKVAFKATSNSTNTTALNQFRFYPNGSTSTPIMSFGENAAGDIMTFYNIAVGSETVNNYTFRTGTTASGILYMNSFGDTRLRVANTDYIIMQSSAGTVSIRKPITTSITAGTGAQNPVMTITAPAHTALTASTEYIDDNFNNARTVQFATGAKTLQRSALFQAPTYSAVAASTFTDSATLAVTGAPVGGTNATLTNSHALLISAGAVTNTTNGYGLTVNAPTGATNNYAAQFLGGTTIFGAPARLKNYTVATLPAGVQGDTAYVTDALAPVWGATVAGGGAVVIPVFYNGANWIVD